MVTSRFFQLLSIISVGQITIILMSTLSTIMISFEFMIGLGKCSRMLFLKLINESAILLILPLLLISELAHVIIVLVILIASLLQVSISLSAQFILKSGTLLILALGLLAHFLLQIETLLVPSVGSLAHFLVKFSDLLFVILLQFLDGVEMFPLALDSLLF